MKNIYFVLCFISFFLILTYVLLNSRELFQEIDIFKTNAISFYSVKDYGSNNVEGDIFKQVGTTGNGKDVVVKIGKVLTSSLASTFLVSGGYNHKKNDLITLRDQSGAKQIIIEVLGVTGIVMKKVLQEEEEEEEYLKEEEQYLVQSAEEEVLPNVEELSEEEEYSKEETGPAFIPRPKKESIEEIYFKLDKENINSLNKYQTKFYDDTEININSSSVRKYRLDKDSSVIKKYSKVYRNIEIPTMNIVKILDKIKDKYKY